MTPARAEAEMDAPVVSASPAWAPLRRRAFRALLLATTVSNVGAWMQEVGRAWLMTELTPSPLFVALFQACAMVAMLLFSLPAGAAADIADRRREVTRSAGAVQGGAAVPDWVRGRALSIFLLAFAAAMAAGSVLWGAVAEAVGTLPALLAASVTGVIAALLALAWPLPARDDPDGRAADRAWPAARVDGAVDPRRGPVLVTVEYRVAPGGADRFRRAMAQIGRRRKAEGSFAWDLYEHAGEPGRFVETNRVGTWGEHLRQRERGTVADAALEADVATCLAPGTVPLVTHWLGGTAAAVEAPPPAPGHATAWIHRLLERP